MGILNRANVQPAVQQNAEHVVRYVQLVVLLVVVRAPVGVFSEFRVAAPIFITVSVYRRGNAGRVVKQFVAISFVFLYIGLMRLSCDTSVAVHGSGR